MQRSRFEDELSRFEAEIGGGGGPPRPSGFGGGPPVPPNFVGGGRVVPPPPPPAVIFNRGGGGGGPPGSGMHMLHHAAGMRSGMPVRNAPPLGGATRSAPSTTFYASGPQTNAEALKAATNKNETAAVDDDEDDVLATLEKYEKEVKKEAKKKAKHGNAADSGSSAPPKKAKMEQPKAAITAAPPISAPPSKTAMFKPKTFVPSQLQHVQMPQNSQMRMGGGPKGGPKPPPPPSAAPSAGGGAGPSCSVTSGAGLPTGVKAPPTATMTNEESWKKAKKAKKVVRTGGGQIWEDDTLKDWDPNDFRIFCGDLGNDVTDEVLARVFGRYPSFTRAKVIRDKKTNKTKGYGFISFREPTDFTKAMREMNGKYVGSRPIKMRKSNWKDRNIDVVRQKQKAKQDMGYKW